MDNPNHIEKEEEAVQKRLMPFLKMNDSLYTFGAYANNKNREDRGGDIPTNFNGKQVYNLDNFKLNPILLTDHDYRASSVLGNVVNAKEDDRGLRISSVLKPLELMSCPRLKEVCTGVIYGFIRTLSIGGIFLHEDERNPNHVTKAYIFEISVVSIPMDAFALIDRPEKDSPDKSASWMSKFRQIYKGE